MARFVTSNNRLDFWAVYVYCCSSI